MGYTDTTSKESGSFEKPQQNHKSASQKTLSKLRKKYCSGTCLKFVYLACATLVSASIIIECILAHLVITPYVSESVFESGVCFLYYTTTGKRVKCENKCSKDRSSFPCANVQVIYIPAPQVQEDQVPKVVKALRYRNPGVREYLKVREARLLYLYDYFSTYAAYKSDRCSTSPCNRREADNAETVDQYLRELHATGIMPCFARPLRKATFSHELQLLKRGFNDSNNAYSSKGVHSLSEDNEQTFLPLLTIDWLREGKNLSATELAASNRLLHTPPSPPTFGGGELNAAALMHRLYPDALLFHSLFWPLTIIICGLLLIALAYSIDGCKVWQADIAVIA
ncbi:unnamed protein product [Rodentolepis nana]|uniref:Calcium permeable stress-gated cation channel 1 n=1 Tax=Rodentolepis nana TaxID=102285 RepID=A0A0R3T9Y1_RODNA|nr:unnamed protein product [Rodentolepis nana]